MRCAKNNRRIYEAAPSTRDSKGPAIKRAQEGIAAVSLPEEDNQSPFIVNGLKSVLVQLFENNNFSEPNFFEKRLEFLGETLICRAYVDKHEPKNFIKLNRYDKMSLIGFIITLGYHQADGLETWRPSIIKFLRDCGFKEVMLDDTIGFGVDLRRKPDVILQAEKDLFKALKQLIERKDLVQKSYKTTSGMSDSEYAKYKGLTPSDDCVVNWHCGTALFKLILSAGNELILIDEEGSQGSLSRFANNSPDWTVASTNDLVKSIWRATDINGLLDESDLDPLKDLLIAQEYMDAADSDEIDYTDALNACSDFVEQELVKAGIIKYAGSLVDFTNLNNVAVACEAITKFLSLADLILPGGRAEVRRTVNKNRKHRITANPSLKAIGESKRFVRHNR